METKPGIYTTEFWTMVLTIVINLVNLFGWWDFTSNWHSGLILTVVTAAYQLSRGLAKSHVPADPGLAANYHLVPQKSDGIKRA